MSEQNTLADNFWCTSFHCQSEEIITLHGVNWSMWNICNTSRSFLQWKIRHDHCLRKKSNGCHTTRKPLADMEIWRVYMRRLSIEAHPACECPHNWNFTNAIQLQVKFLLPPPLWRDSGRFQFSSLAGWHPDILWKLQSKHSMPSCEE